MSLVDAARANWGVSGACSTDGPEDGSSSASQFRLVVFSFRSEFAFSCLFLAVLESANCSPYGYFRCRNGLGKLNHDLSLETSKAGTCASTMCSTIGVKQMHSSRCIIDPDIFRFRFLPKHFWLKQGTQETLDPQYERMQNLVSHHRLFTTLNG